MCVHAIMGGVLSWVAARVCGLVVDTTLVLRLWRVSRAFLQVVVCSVMCSCPSGGILTSLSLKGSHGQVLIVFSPN